MPAARTCPDADGLRQRFLVDQPTAGGVDDDHARLGLGQRLLADQPGGLLGLRKVHRNEVGTAEQLVKGQQLDAELRGTRGRYVRVIRDDVRAERGQSLRHQLADAAEPHHADGLAVNLGTGELRAFPRVLTQRCVGSRDLAGRGKQQRERMLGGTVDVRRRRVDHKHAASGGGVHVDVVQAHAGARDDLELGRGRENLGVDGGGRAHQQRIGFRHGGQQLLSVRAVDPADLYLVAKGGDGRFSQFVGDQYNGKTHPASLMGLNYDVDVTVVGSGPNGLAAAVICARAGLSVQVFEAQPTMGGGARTLADPEYAGVAHDICSAVHPLALASPFLAEFDLPARGVTLKVPEVAYANPLPGQPAASRLPRFAPHLRGAERR